MNYDDQVFAVCYDNFKEVALYFPNFLPVTVGGEGRELLLDSGVNPEHWYAMVYYALGVSQQFDLAYVTFCEENALTDEEWSRLDEVIENSQSRNNLILQMLCAQLGTSCINFLPVFGISSAYRSYAIREAANDASIVSKFVRFLQNDAGFNPDFIFGQPNAATSAGQSADAIELQLLNTQIIDATKLEWRQIYDIRKDSIMQIKLRNFRLFLYDKMKDKSQAYVFDSISKKIDEYESACRKHGLELVEATVSSLLDSKSALAAVAIATAGLLLGEPAIVEGSVLAGTVIEIGKTTIKLAPKISAFQAMKREHEIAYLMELKKKIDKS